MNIYNVEETSIGNYFKINYLLARQLMIIFDTYNQRILDATIEDIKDTICETVYYWTDSKSDKKHPKFNYDEVPRGWIYYISQKERHKSYIDFINWFFKHKQQPKDYLINGILKNRNEKKKDIGEDKTVSSSEYGGIPLEIEDKHGKSISKTYKRF